jgi:lipoprotein signal peptidase/HEAT repeat protein
MAWAQPGEVSNLRQSQPRRPDATGKVEAQIANALGGEVKPTVADSKGESEKPKEQVSKALPSYVPAVTTTKPSFGAKLKQGLLSVKKWITNNKSFSLFLFVVAFVVIMDQTFKFWVVHISPEDFVNQVLSQTSAYRSLFLPPTFDDAVAGPVLNIFKGASWAIQPLLHIAASFEHIAKFIIFLPWFWWYRNSFITSWQKAISFGLFLGGGLGNLLDLILRGAGWDWFAHGVEISTGEFVPLAVMNIADIAIFTAIALMVFTPVANWIFSFILRKLEQEESVIITKKNFLSLLKDISQRFRLALTRMLHAYFSSLEKDHPLLQPEHSPLSIRNRSRLLYIVTISLLIHTAVLTNGFAGTRRQLGSIIQIADALFLQDAKARLAEVGSRYSTIFETGPYSLMLGRGDYSPVDKGLPCLPKEIFKSFESGPVFIVYDKDPTLPFAIELGKETVDPVTREITGPPMQWYGPHLIEDVTDPTTKEIIALPIKEWDVKSFERMRQREVKEDIKEEFAKAQAGWQKWRDMFGSEEIAKVAWVLYNYSVRIGENPPIDLSELADNLREDMPLSFSHIQWGVSLWQQQTPSPYISDKHKVLHAQLSVMREVIKKLPIRLVETIPIDEVKTDVRSQKPEDREKQKKAIRILRGQSLQSKKPQKTQQKTEKPKETDMPIVEFPESVIPNQEIVNQARQELLGYLDKIEAAAENIAPSTVTKADSAGVSTSANASAKPQMPDTKQPIIRDVKNRIYAILAESQAPQIKLNQDYDEYLFEMEKFASQMAARVGEHIENIEDGVEVLFNILQDRYAVSVHVNAVIVLGEIARTHEQTRFDIDYRLSEILAREVFKQEFLEYDWHVYDAIVRVRVMIGNGPTLRYLESILDDPFAQADWRIREAIAETLGQRVDAESIPALARATRDENTAIRHTAAVSLARMAIHYNEALYEALHIRQTDKDVHRSMVKELREGGRSMASLLVEFLDRRYPLTVTKNAASILRGIRTNMVEIIPALIKIINDGNENDEIVRDVIIAAGHSIFSPDSTERLKDALIWRIDRRWQDPLDVSLAAIATLGRLGLPDTDVVDTLLGVLTNPSWPVAHREKAARSLADLKATDALPEMRRMLRRKTFGGEKNAAVRNAVRQAREKIEASVAHIPGTGLSPAAEPRQITELCTVVVEVLRRREEPIDSPTMNRFRRELMMLLPEISDIPSPDLAAFAMELYDAAMEELFVDISQRRLDEILAQAEADLFEVDTEVLQAVGRQVEHRMREIMQRSPEFGPDTLITIAKYMYMSALQVVEEGPRVRLAGQEEQGEISVQAENAAASGFVTSSAAVTTSAASTPTSPTSSSTGHSLAAIMLATEILHKLSSIDSHYMVLHAQQVEQFFINDILTEMTGLILDAKKQKDIDKKVFVVVIDPNEALREDLVSNLSTRGFDGVVGIESKHQIEFAIQQLRNEFGFEDGDYTLMFHRDRASHIDTLLLPDAPEPIQLDKHAYDAIVTYLGSV